MVRFNPKKRHVAGTPWSHQGSSALLYFASRGMGYSPSSTLLGRLASTGTSALDDTMLNIEIAAAHTNDN